MHTLYTRLDSLSPNAMNKTYGLAYLTYLLSGST